MKVNPHIHHKGLNVRVWVNNNYKTSIISLITIKSREKKKKKKNLLQFTSSNKKCGNQT